MLAYPARSELESTGMVFNASLVISHELVVAKLGKVEEGWESLAEALVDSCSMVRSKDIRNAKIFQNVKSEFPVFIYVALNFLPRMSKTSQLREVNLISDADSLVRFELLKKLANGLDGGFIIKRCL